MKTSTSLLVLSDHAYKRWIERKTYMSRAEAERYIIGEIKLAYTKSVRKTETGESEIKYLSEGISYIVKQNIIVTVY